MMDLQTALVCLLIVIVSAAVLLFIAMFGIKEKSYEEALAEQRQQIGGLLNTQQKSKLKEKKLKKAVKKAKEKSSSITETEDKLEESESAESSRSDSHREKTAGQHVEFRPELSDATASKRRNKKERVRPILHNRDEHSPVVEEDDAIVLQSNHFVKLHPKDEVELVHAHGKEEAPPKPAPEPKTKPKTKSESEPSAKQKGKNQKQTSVESETEVKVETKPEAKPKKNQKQPVEAVVEPEVKPGKGKPSKTVEEVKNQKVETETELKTKNEETVKPGKVKNVKQSSVDGEERGKVKEKQPSEEPSPPQPSPERVAPVTNGNSIKDKKKKKSEFNTLQQMTGDRQGVNVSLLVPLIHKAELSRSEIQILIDLLLNKQLEAPVILEDWSEGRADPVQKLKKQLAEKEKLLEEKQEALISTQAKLRERSAELNSERSRFTQNVRHLEETLQAKQLELQALNARLLAQNQKMQQQQAQLNEEMLNVRKLREDQNAVTIQRQQLEMHLAGLNEQQQEAEATFQAQITQLRAELQEQQNLNAQINMELQRLREQSRAEKDMLHDRLRTLEGQAAIYKKDLEQRQDLGRQLEEARVVYTDLEQRLGRAHHNETELKLMVQQHLEEARRFELAQAQACEEASKLQGEVLRLSDANKQQQEESEKLIAQLKSELLSLQDNSSTNGAVENDKEQQQEIVNLHSEIDSLKAQLQQRESQMNQELESARNTIQVVQTEVETQRNKNNDLRQKNWKVMEALNAAEVALKASRNKEQPSRVARVDEHADRLKDEQESNKRFLQRLFPQVEVAGTLSYDRWLGEFEKGVREHVGSLKVVSEDSGDIVKLQTQVTQYKVIIEDTEGMLNKLQAHIEKEEANWRKELLVKEAEIEALREQKRVEMETQLASLDKQLRLERESRKELEAEYEALKSRGPGGDGQQPSTGLGDVEKLSEENSRLAEELDRERLRSRELNEKLSTLETTNSLPAKVPQNHVTESNGPSLDGTLCENGKK